jgi:tRNA (cmo5U34)-methyltransferase
MKEWSDPERVAEYLSHEIPHRQTAEAMRKRTLFAEIRSLLEPDGVFANLDLVRAPTPELHERFRREIGRPEDDPADRLAALCDQLSWLRAAGFAAVDCHFKWLQLTLMVGTAF